VAELAGRPVRTVEQPAVGDDRAADARRDRQVDDVVAAPGRAECPLTERSDVRVALEECGQADGGPDRRPDREAPERPAEIRRVTERAGPRVERAGRGDPERLDPGTYLARRGVTGGPEEIDARANDRVGAVGGGRPGGLPRQSGSIGEDRRGSDLGATQIEREDRT
jgi:hypothetical protein